MREDVSTNSNQRKRYDNSNSRKSGETKEKLANNVDGSPLTERRTWGGEGKTSDRVVEKAWRYRVID